jgi:predicted nucleic acid-binding protein
MAGAGKLEVAGSDIVDDELSQMTDDERREKVELLLTSASSHISLTAAIERRAMELQEWNIAPLDALHLASAESAHVDCFLTTDDSLLRKAGRKQCELKVKIENPAQWLIEESAYES